MPASITTTHPWRIGLLAPRPQLFYAHEIISGMIATRLSPGQALKPVDLLYRREEDIPKLLDQCPLDGLILGLDNGRYQKYSKYLPDVPMINVHPDHLSASIPTIAISPAALADATVRYFQSLGISNIATVSTATTEAQQRVNAHLKKQVSQNGGIFHDFPVVIGGITSNYEEDRRIPQIEELDNCLRSLTPPTGLLCSGGYTAITVAQSAHQLGLKIPETLSILSRSDDNICLFADPPISSFRSVGPLVGKLALTAMINHLNGQPLPNNEISLPAPSVVERLSTGLPSGIDPNMSDAIHFIRRNAFNHITMDDVTGAIPSLSRSRLYRKFENYFGRSPAQEIIRLRIEEAKYQLGFTGKSLCEIADHCSFKTPTHFSAVFTREVGSPPGTWRKNNTAQLNT